MGFAGQTAKLLEDSLLNSQAKTGKAGPIKIWVSVVEHTNAPYWTRRGFKEVQRQTKPAGTWGYRQDFVLLEMVKIINPST
jgi:hypothetical protein